MKFKKLIVPAHREYFLTLVRNNGERIPWYIPYGFHSEAEAQASADAKNRVYKHGKMIVEYVDRPESVAYTGPVFTGKRPSSLT